MITYKQIFAVLRQGAYINPSPNTDLLSKLLILERAGIVHWRIIENEYVLHPKQIKPKSVVLVVDIPPKTAPKNDLGRVRVDWSGRGHSSGSYKVLADKGKYLEIVFELDVERVVTVAKTRVKAA